MTASEIQMPEAPQRDANQTRPKSMPAFTLEVAGDRSGAVMQDRLQLAKLYYQKHLDELRALADQSIKPFDEPLYSHARTLELRHYAAFRAILKGMPTQRPELAQFWVRGLMEAPATYRRH